ncbi:MAG: PQQ-binding-like beta-propeller repeat protein [Thermodesulfobacteriota bacterium]
MAALLLSGCAGKRLPAEGVTPWSSYLYDDTRTNATPDAATPPLEKSWDRDISAFNLFTGHPKSQLSSPALSGGALFVGSTDSEFYSIDMDTGKLLWKFDAGAPIEAPPAVTEQIVCFGSSDGILRCLDRSGRPLWEFRVRSEILSSPVIRDSMVYFTSADDRLYALAAQTGEKLWTYRRRIFKTVTPRVYASAAYSDGRLYAFFSDGTLVCLAADTGKELWKKRVVRGFDGAAPVRRTPLVSGKTVYAIDDKNAVLALDSSTGDVKGIYNIIKAVNFVVLDDRKLVVAGQERIVSMDMPTGAILWKKELAHSPLQSIFAAGDILYVLSNQKHTPLGLDFLAARRGYMEALRLSDGEKVWEKKLGSSISANGSSARSAVALLPDKGGLILYATP